MDDGTLVRDLSRTEAYPGPAREVTRLQTHVSWLFFAGERVYKVKKPVDLGFLDFTRLEARRRACEDEVRLNRRLAPEVYLGVVPIVRGEGGRLVVGDGSESEPVEWAVEMVRLPSDRMLDVLLERGGMDNAVVDSIVDLLVPFHAAAASGPGVDEHGSPEAVRRNVEENFDALERHVGTTAERSAGRALLSRTLLEFQRGRADRFLEARAPLFERRLREGRIREGHGDLHAGNLCILESGVVAYDCIEFAARFRCGDVAADLAFLCMDLGRRGYPAFGAYLARRYADATEDAELLELLPFYMGYFAVVRAKVAAMASTDEGLPRHEQEEKRREAMSYLDLAAGFELPPALVMLCGLPASGKSFVARAVARSLGAALLQSDVRRKLRAGRDPRESAREEPGRGLYAPERRDEIYRSLLESAVETVRGGHSAVVDATFSLRSRRAPFGDAMARLSLPWFLIHVTADEALVRSRLEKRADPTSAASESSSDAGLAVYEAEKSTFESPDELAHGHRLDVRSEVDPLEEVGARLTDLRIRSAGAAAE